MAEVRHVSRALYLGAHLAVIIVHVIMALIILYVARYEKLYGYPWRTWAYGVGVVLLLLSLTSIAPFFMKTDQDILIEKQ